MSQPPTPYDRSYSFTAWSVSNPDDPHQGQKIDQQLDAVATSIDQTIDRLNEVQADDGKLRASAFPQSFKDDVESVSTDALLASAFASAASGSATAAAGSASQAASSASSSAASASASASSAAASSASAAQAQAVYDTNLAELPDKQEARDNLQLDQFHPRLDGQNLVIYSDPQSFPTFPSYNYTQGQVSQDQQSSYPNWAGILSGSTNVSRQFRASVLFGTLKDYATDWADVGGSPVPDVTARVDNVSFALLYAGSPGEFTGSPGPGWVNMAGYLTGNYTRLANMPSAFNPLVSTYMLKDAIDTHKGLYDHTRIPSITEKAALVAASVAGANGTNRLAVLSDLTTGGVLTSNQAAAINNAENPSAGNPLITQSRLTDQLDTGLAGKSDVGHTHNADEIMDAATGMMSVQNMIDQKADLGYVDSELASRAYADHTHMATGIADSTSVGRSLLTAFDAPAARSFLGLGSAATQASSAFMASSALLGKLKQLSGDKAYSDVTLVSASYTTAASVTLNAKSTGSKFIILAQGDTENASSTTPGTSTTRVYRTSGGGSDPMFSSPSTSVVPVSNTVNRVVIAMDTPNVSAGTNVTYAVQGIASAGSQSLKAGTFILVAEVEA